MKSVVLIATLLVSGALYALSTEPQGMSTPADVVRLIRVLEQAPLGDAAIAIRSELLAWATETKDVTITTCDVLGPIPGNDVDAVPYGPELLVQAMFGNGAFQLEHPESKGDEVKAQLAGITSMLRAYKNIIVLDPSARIPQFDNWLDDLNAGNLSELLTPAIREKCIALPTEGTQP